MALIPFHFRFPAFWLNRAQNTMFTCTTHHETSVGVSGDYRSGSPTQTASRQLRVGVGWLLFGGMVAEE